MTSGLTYHLRVPATSANLGPGYDCLGAAFNLHNGFRLTLLEPAVWEVAVEGPEAYDLQLSPDSNLVVRGFQRGWELGGGEGPAPGLRVELEVHVPTTRGLGSSSSAIVAGMTVGYHAASGHLDWPRLLEEMTALEGHPDNVLPAALGGLVCGAWEPGCLSYVQRPISEELRAVAFVPEAKLATRKARAALPAEVPHRDAVFNAARVALVFEALAHADLGLLRRVMEDRLHQPYRRHLVEAYDAFERFAGEAGLPFAISGAGPSMLLWTRAAEAEGIRLEFAAANEDLVRRGSLRVLKPNNSGIVCPEFERMQLKPPAKEIAGSSS